MEFIDFLELMGVIIHLEKEALLRAHIHFFNLLQLNKRIWLIVTTLEVEYVKHSVPGMVVQYDWGSRQMLILDPPESDVLSTTADQFVYFYGRPLQSKDVEITHLLTNELWFLVHSHLRKIKNHDHLTVVTIKPNHGQVF